MEIQTEKKIYKLGVVGLGEGRSIMSASLNSPQWELHTVCDLNEELCRKRSEEFSFTNWTTSYEEMLQNPEIDVIAIYTPDQLHQRHISQALQANKHVICTKPLLTSLEGAKELLDLVNGSDRKVFVGQSSRFFEGMLHQRRDYEAGRHGELETLEAQYITDARWFLERDWSRQKGFSWMYNFMIHAVDLVRWYMPGVTEVTGYGKISANSRSRGIEAWDSLRFLLQDEEGRIAEVAGNYTMPTLGELVEPSISCLLRGTEGTSRAEYSKLSYHTHFTGEDPQSYSYDDKRGYYFRFEGNSHHAGEYQNYIEYFADCLDRGETPLPDAAEAIRTLALMEAMELSAQQGGVKVRIDDIMTKYGLN